MHHHNEVRKTPRGSKFLGILLIYSQKLIFSFKMPQFICLSCRASLRASRNLTHARKPASQSRALSSDTNSSPDSNFTTAETSDQDPSIHYRKVKPRSLIRKVKVELSSFPKVKAELPSVPETPIPRPRNNWRQHKVTLPPRPFEVLLSKPTWSVRSLLPSSTSTVEALPRSVIEHLLRLSALPVPKSEAALEKISQTLQSQLHFVAQVQSVDTTGVEPLRALRDETAEGRKAAMMSLETPDIKSLLAAEVKGRLGRPFRKPPARLPWLEDSQKTTKILNVAERRVGRFYVVESRKPEGAE
jgi:Asp-tRNA(Asn)/Glu-tRNA(Gln) amidotransferase C subunit